VIKENVKMGVVVFGVGACGMILELTASRVLSPYFGNSIIVWTSLIGLILGAMSLGNILGGWLAEKDKENRTLFWILLFASLAVGITILIKEFVLGRLSYYFVNNMEVAVLFSVLLLFGPTSVFLGIVTPMVIRDSLAKIKDSGTMIGGYYALATLGSIVGTFGAGFYLIPRMGNVMVLQFVFLVLLLLSGLVVKLRKEGYWWLIGLIMLVFVFLNIKDENLGGGVLVDRDSRYSRIIIKDVDNGGRKIRVLSNDVGGWESILDVSRPEEALGGYFRACRLVDVFYKEAQKTLMIGGAGYSYPRDFLRNHPLATMDVVEIDPTMTELARKYFFLKDDPRLKIFHEDARTFLRKTNEKYDVIFMDAFWGATPPYYLTTKEFWQQTKNVLNRDGAIIINLVSAIEGERSNFLKSEKKTLEEVFEQVEVFKLGKKEDIKEQNLLVVAFASKQMANWKTNDIFLQAILNNRLINIKNDMGFVLSDDFAPVEFMTRSF